jgi:hypothetical protein
MSCNSGFNISFGATCVNVFSCWEGEFSELANVNGGFLRNHDVQLVGNEMSLCHLLGVLSGF